MVATGCDVGEVFLVARFVVVRGAGCPSLWACCPLLPAAPYSWTAWGIAWTSRLDHPRFRDCGRLCQARVEGAASRGTTGTHRSTNNEQERLPATVGAATFTYRHTWGRVKAMLDMTMITIMT